MWAVVNNYTFSLTSCCFSLFPALYALFFSLSIYTFSRTSSHFLLFLLFFALSRSLCSLQVSANPAVTAANGEAHHIVVWLGTAVAVVVVVV